MPCEQPFTALFNLGDACTLEGKYRINFTIMCRADISEECPLGDMFGRESEVFTLRSENGEFDTILIILNLLMMPQFAQILNFQSL